MKAGAQFFAHLKQLLKLYTRQRDKAMMLSIVEEVSTLPYHATNVSRSHRAPF